MLLGLGRELTLADSALEFGETMGHDASSLYGLQILVHLLVLSIEVRSLILSPPLEGLPSLAHTSIKSAMFLQGYGSLKPIP